MRFRPTLLVVGALLAGACGPPAEPPDPDAADRPDPAPTPTAGATIDHGDVVVASTTEGRVILLDLATGEEAGEVDAHGGEAYPRLSAAPGGDTVFHDRHITGSLQEVWASPLDGSEPSKVADGRVPAVSPNGQRLAYVALSVDFDEATVIVRDLATGDEQTWSAAAGQDEALDVAALSWAADSTRLAFELTSAGRDEGTIHGPDRFEIGILDTTVGGSLLDSDFVEPADADSVWRAPVWRGGHDELAVVELCCDLDQRQVHDPDEAAVVSVDVGTGEAETLLEPDELITALASDPAGEQLAMIATEPRVEGEHPPLDRLVHWDGTRLREVARDIVQVAWLGAVDDPEDPVAVQLPPVPAEPPAVAIAATSDHRVVVLDPHTGEELRTLEAYDDPETFEEQTGEPHAAGRFFDSLALSPDGETAYISVCCEPAPGRLFRVPVAGGEPEQLGHGYEPAVRADGQRLAVTELQWVTILDPDGEVIEFFEPDPAVAIGLGRPAWSPDGRLVVFERYEEGLEAPELMLLEVETATTMGDATPLPRPDGDERPWTRPSFDRQGRLLVAEQELDQDGDPAGPATQLLVDPASGEALERRDLPAGVRTQVHDASGGWLLTVLGDGSARWTGPDGEEHVLGAGLLAAAW